MDALTRPVACLVLIAALSACDARSATTANPTPGGPSVHTRAPSATPPGPDSALRVTAAAPIKRQAQRRGRIPALTGAISTTVLAASETGDVLVKRTPAGHPGLIAGERLDLLRPGNQGHATAIPRLPPEGPAQQVIAADISARYVTWMESSSTELAVNPWVLYAFERKSGRTVELATSPRVDGKLPPAAPGDTGPTLAGDRVFWAQVGGHRGAETVAVYGCRIGDCRPRIVARDSAFPSATATTLYAVKAARFAGKQSSTTAEVLGIDLRSGAQRTLARLPLKPGEAPTGLAAAGTHLSWLVASPGRDKFYVLDTETGQQQQVISEREGAFGFPVATRRFVAVAESSGTSVADVGGYLFEFATGKLYSIGNTAGLYNIVGAGDTVVWQDSTTPMARPQDIVNVIATLR